MSEHKITVEGGSTVRLTTAGKYCDRDIVVTATGGSGEVQPTVTAIDYSGFAGGNFTATFSDGVTDPYGVQFDTEGRPIKVTRADGSEVEVDWGNS